MKVYHTYGGQYLMHGREFPKGTVVLQLDNGVEMYCSNFKTKSRTLWFCYMILVKKNGFVER